MESHSAPKMEARSGTKMEPHGVPKMEAYTGTKMKDHNATKMEVHTGTKTASVVLPEWKRTAVPKWNPIKAPSILQRSLFTG